MNTRRTLRLLTPLLAAFVVACNINESNSPQATSFGTGRLRPRLAMANGTSITKVDSLAISVTVEGSAYSKRLLAGWGDSSLRLDGIPLNKRWTAKIAGFNNAVGKDSTARDTIWYGEDTGTLASSNPQSVAGETFALLLKSLAVRPTVSLNSATLPSSIKVGTSLDLAAGNRAQVVWTLNGSVPTCSSAVSSTKPLVLPDSLAGKTVTLKARTCAEGTLPSSIVTVTFQAVAKDAILPPQIAIPSGYDTNSTTTQDWTKSLTLDLPPKTTLNWNLVLTTSTKLDSVWKTIPVPSTTPTGTGAKISIPASLIDAIPVKDSLIFVLVKALLKDSSGASADTIHLQWTSRFPVTPKPTLKSIADTTSILVEWDTLFQLWAKRYGGSWDKVSPASTDSTFLHTQLTPGQIDSFKAISKSESTGRYSDTAYWCDTALVPPTKPGFAVNNEDGLGNILISLDSASSAQPRTKWFVSHATDSSSLAYSSDDTIKNGAWKGYMSKGQTVIGIKAVRDGLSAVSIKTFTVVDSSGGRPSKVMNLRLATRDSSVLTWKWDPMPGRSFRIFVKPDTFFTSAADTTNITPTVITDSSFSLSTISPNTARAIAVVTVATGSEKAGNSMPAFSILARTRNPPSKPSWSYTKNDSTGTLIWNLSSSESGTVWQALWGPSTAALGTFDIGAAKTLTKSPMSGTGLIGVRAIRDSVIRDSILGQAITVKYTNSYTPNAPENLSATAKGTDSLLLTWSYRDGHTYLVKWKYPSVVTAELSKPTDSAAVSSMGSKLLTGLLAGTAVVYSVQVTASLDSTKGPSTASTGRTATNAYIPKNLGTTSLSATTAVIVGNRLSVNLPVPSSVSYTSLTSPSQIVARLYKGIVRSETWNASSASITGTSSLDSNALGTYSLYIQHVWENGDTTASQQLPLHSYSPSPLSLSNYAGGTAGDTIDVASPTSSSGWGNPEFQAYDGINLAWAPATYSASAGKLTGPSAMQRIRHRFAYVTTATGDSSMWVETALEKHGTMTDTRDGKSYPTVRLNGLTWMASNLNYTIPGDDSVNLCYGGGSSNCGSTGHLYTAAQALNIRRASNSINHDCDTLPNAGLSGSICALPLTQASLPDSQGVCPSGWRIPSSPQLSAIMSFKSHLLGATWSGDDAVGFNLIASGQGSRTRDSIWTYTGGPDTSSRKFAILWSLTPYANQAIEGGYISPSESTYTGIQPVWYYDPTVAPRPRSAFSVRCVKN